MSNSTRINWKKRALEAEYELEAYKHGGCTPKMCDNCSSVICYIAPRAYKLSLEDRARLLNERRLIRNHTRS